jgi:hypothetical protein
MTEITNPLSRMIITKLAERRGLRVVSIREKLVVVAPDAGASPDAVEAAIASLKDELNRGKSQDIDVQLDTRI